ncbi:MAG TPA: DHHA1 domain-containing protein [Gemmatimonadales bacterium]|nr:DHHA1 domain-containing protein [Gemmatimonadales bacterium]
MPTERLYYRDATLLTFSAQVTARDDGGRRIYLDRTAFYPTSGGQPFDTGLLGGIRVEDVVDEEDRIAHLLAAPLESPQVEGQVDAGRRRDHMEQHTGQHLLSAVVEDLFRAPTASVHFGPESSSIDLSIASLTADQARQAERRANDLIRENRPVVVSFEDAATVQGLRKPTGRTGEIRVITIEGVDRSACGGTHVSATGQIGALLVRKVERAKGMVRMEFLCGGRTVERARSDYEVLAGLAAARSAAMGELPALLEKERSEFKSLQSARRELEERVAGYRAAELYANTKPRADGVRWLHEQVAEGGAEALRALAQAVTGMEKAVLVGNSVQPAALVIASSADSGVDAGQLLKKGIADVGGRGGGSPRVAQGSAPDQAALAGLVARLLAD